MQLVLNLTLSILKDAADAGRETYHLPALQ
jgi:hypothetical protein